MFEAYVRRRWKLLDASSVYRKGASETFFGNGLERRCIRRSANVIVKGVHTPHYTPEAMIGQRFAESRDRLRTEHADV